MSKLGYTWYPKDWGNSEAVFELNLSERGLYRELIDMAMLNDNTTIINSRVWCRKFDIEHDDLWLIIEKIKELKLIEIINEDSEDEDLILFIPSCEPRLKLVRGGKKGGEKSVKNKPIVKPIDKPLVSLEEKVDKHTPNQRKVKEKKLNIKEKENNNNIPSFSDFKIFSLEKAERLNKQIDLVRLELKYESWIENNWVDGNGVPIKNWKSKIMNTLPYLCVDKKKSNKATDNLAF